VHSFKILEVPFCNTIIFFLPPSSSSQHEREGGGGREGGQPQGRGSRRRRGATQARARWGRRHGGCAVGEGERRGKGARGRDTTVGGESGEREGLRVWERKNRELHGQQWRRAHRTRRGSPELRIKSSIGSEPTVGSTNQTHRDKLSMRHTQRYPRILPTTHRLKVIDRRSYHRSWNHRELRRAIPGIVDRIWGNSFEI
jgi:hypothetical protein